MCDTFPAATIDSGSTESSECLIGRQEAIMTAQQSATGHGSSAEPGMARHPGLAVVRTHDVLLRRIGAFYFDMTLYTIAVWLLAAFNWEERHRVAMSEDAWVKAMIGAALVGFVLVKAVPEAFFGKTIGKKLVGLEVVNETGDPAGVFAAVVRNLLLVPSAVLFFILSLVMIATTRRHQRLGDMVAGTLVVGLASRRQDGAASTASPAEASYVAQAPHRPKGSARAGYPITALPVEPTPILDAQAGGEPARRWLLPGAGLVLAATTTGLTMLMVRGATGNERADEPPPIWLHTATSEATGNLLLLTGVLLVPFAIGRLTRSINWAVLASAMVFASYVIALIAYQPIVDDHYGLYERWPPELPALQAIGWLALPIAAGAAAAVGLALGRGRVTSPPPSEALHTPDDRTANW
jgi:uncharacterized RDD family membrane protein YckC